MTSARLPSLAKTVITYPADVGKAHPGGIIAPFLKNGCRRGHIRIVSLLIPAVKDKALRDVGGKNIESHQRKSQGNHPGFLLIASKLERR
jgi:hypothetical protein